MRRFIVDRFSYEKIRSAEGESHMNQCRKIRIVQGQRSLKRQTVNFTSQFLWTRKHSESHILRSIGSTTKRKHEKRKWWKREERTRSFKDTSIFPMLSILSSQYKIPAKKGALNGRYPTKNRTCSRYTKPKKRSSWLQHGAGGLPDGQNGNSEWRNEKKRKEHRSSRIRDKTNATARTEYQFRVPVARFWAYILILFNTL